MKKIYIAALAVLVTAVMSSCVREKSFEDIKLGENEIVFKFQGVSVTRSGEVNFPTKKGVTFQIRNEGSAPLTLEETITDLNAMSPVTRGTPAYTENVGVLYFDNMGVYSAGFGDITYENLDDKIRDNGGWRYHHAFTKAEWETGWAASDPAYFYLRMPADMSSYGVTLPTSGYSNGAISFTYSSPLTAAAQRDILFAARQLSKSELNGFRPEGAPVLFHHALTGVKFRITNDQTDIDAKKIVRISHIAFIGLQNSGSCVVTPKKEALPPKEGEEPAEGDYVDIPSVYSSGDGTTVIWSNRDAAKDNRIEQAYTEDGFVTFEKGDGNNFADSYYEGGQTMNVNAEDGSLTFWLVPQVFNATNKNNVATLEIKYVVLEDGAEVEKSCELNFGSVLASNNVEWKPGELRTYSIKIDEVNVKIDDTVVTQNPDKEYKNSTKTNVCITNTGDTDAYIRAAIIGQWLDEYGNPVFGFSDYTDGKVKLVESWYQDQFGPDAKHNHGEFEGLVGYDPSVNAATSKWIKVGDYYYYKEPVEPGFIIGTAPTDASEAEKDYYLGNPLFTKYTIKDAPDVTVATAKKPIWFELEIAVQAISANKNDGDHYSLSEAWARAGVTIPED